jgi:hypothetical protein
MNAINVIPSLRAAFWSAGACSRFPAAAASRRTPNWICRIGATQSILLACLSFVAVSSSRAETDRVKYDGQCLTVDGKDMIVFSGAFHYFRCPQPLWRDRFQKIKEAGFNAVDTYVPWNWYERDRPGPMDFSDLKAWMKMAHEEFGLYTIIRPGPYICAEWDGGGFPRWLLTKKPAKPKRDLWLRSDDPVFLEWSKHWYDAVCPVIAAEQVTRKPVGQPGVILFQIENEYDLYHGLPEDARVNHLRALYQYATANGIDVPIFTCWTKQCRNSKDDLLRHVFDGPNMYPRWNMKAVEDRLRAVRAEQPNAPVMVPELQGGWFAQVGGKLSEDQDGIDAAQIHYLTMLNLQEGTTILNYYMLFGGSNFGDWAARDNLTSYDYFAPIREPGGVGDKYRAVKAIGQMLHKHGASLARSTVVATENPETNVTITVRRHGDESFVFCRNLSRTDAKRGAATVNGTKIAYDLPPAGFRLLHLPSGQWWPKPVYPPARPASVPSPVRIATAQKRPASAAKWEPAKPGQSLPELGVNDSRFVLYRARPKLSAAQIARYDTLKLDLFTSDAVVWQVNGQIVLSGDVSQALRQGQNEIIALYENRGQPNFGPEIADLAGIRSAMLTSRGSLGLPLENWRVSLGEFDEAKAESFVLNDQTVAELAGQLQPGSTGPKYPAAKILFGKKTNATFRTTVVLPEVKWTKLEFDCIDDSGVVSVNGQRVGESKDYRKRFEVDVAKQLRPGTNVIEVVVRNDDGAGGLTKPARLTGGKIEGVELKFEFARELTAAGHWSAIGLDTKKPIARKGHDAPSGQPEALAMWYRMQFELPDTPSDVWVPWRLLLDASGNGFIELNGRALGRYWEAGPQREFYLPECWLQFGPGKTNVLTLCLRPTGNGAVLRAAELAPYAEYAEVRAEKPRINGAKVFGVRPGSPFLFTIAASGERPMEFGADGLPDGLTLDGASGRISGVLGEPGEHVVTLRAKNAHGVAERKLRIVVGDKIALTPPMGWNSWNCWAGAVDQDKVLRSARAMMESGLAQHGWTYINIDDTWQGRRGGEFHAIQPNEKFPDMKALCDEIHRLGLKAGIYSTPWVTSYAKHIGGSAENPEGTWEPPKGKIDYSGKVMPLALGKYSFATNDALQWAAWGFDYLKYDWFPNDVPHVQEMADALRASGRDVVYSLSNTAPFEEAANWARLANCWRTTGDITDTWKSISDIGFAQDKWTPFAGPGHWNDPDMLVVGWVGWGPRLHPTKLTRDEQRTHISLWCLLSAPLLLGCDLERLDDFTLGLLTNDEVLEVNQDPLGRQASRVSKDGDLEVWAKEMEDGSKAVGLFNRGESESKVAARWSDLGLSGRQRVRDLWRQKDLGVFEGEFEATAPAHGVVLIKVEPVK